MRRLLRPLAAEAALLGLFMASACGFAALLWSPASPVAALVPDDLPRRLLMGLAMGATAVLLLRSRWARVSGGHLNPAVTFAFWRLGRIRGADAAAYSAAQAFGGLAGVLAAGALLGRAVSDPPVRWAVTSPGPHGPLAAFTAEAGIAAAMFGAVLATSRSPFPGAAPWVAAALLALFVAFVSPVSGTSLNPARTLASAIPAGAFESVWVYVTAPVLGMAAAAETALRLGASRGCCSVCAPAPGGCPVPVCVCRAPSAAALPEVTPCPNATT